MTRTAVWKCPALCGCELSITADWAQEPPIEDGRRVSYQHPRPFTITAISIVSVCPEHDALRMAELPADPYGGRPGYIRLPLDHPMTEAERLYIHLYQYTGQRFTPDTCRCHIYESVHRGLGTVRTKQHPRHTKRCPHHLHDDDQHTEARENGARKARIVARIAEQFGVNPDAIGWSFDAQRILHVNIAGITNAQRTGAQTWANTNLGAGRVVVTNT